jgi:purine-nucleoside phosphorylase
MTEQKSKIIESVNYLKENLKLKKYPSVCIVTYKNPLFLKEFELIKRIKYADIPPRFDNVYSNDGELIYAKMKNSSKYFFILNGRFNNYDGYSMRDIAHPIYALKELGVSTAILIEDTGYLNPRYSVGDIAMIYDHINLMGGNPLIGQNDETLGTRFPDMSNAYDSALFKKIEKVFIRQKFTFYPAVFLGIMGPQSETEAECRFYRDTGADVLGYGIVPENIAVVHSGMKCAAFGLCTRELVADRMDETSPEEYFKNRTSAEKNFGKILPVILNVI